ncbi:hypothetical protein COS91_01840 [Candidatus Desantisbacteria bacterium CG07_land_8_20_14_0_80_39_15]|uniref:Uncharacterized protein n=1 Tax=Candidatus Desantisbacteria bacterium CG07_land_8_20_14_0_80_39_15 TaxID=1974549 RepID=A0A2M6ZHS6_9BACT|nr:MAG: hypothetical protein COS91_01840 [Candidatus Desantisbacteria bacterium CG07_land_8_20_14_0_80_39_15]
MNPVPEIRREKVFVPPEMTTKEIKEKYGLSSEKSYKVKKQGFFVKNYSKKQIIIDPENFDPAISYSTAKRVFWKNFAWNSVAQSIKEDLIQEAVTRMYELSGRVKEGANAKYGIGYSYFWVAHNAMLSYLKTWKRQMRFQVFGDINDEEMAIRIYNYRKELIL